MNPSLKPLLFLVLILPLAAGQAADRVVETGMLTAYTGTDTYDSGQVDYYPHTGYRIFHANGSFYRYVKNHTSQTDEMPYRIILPVGKYYVLAESENHGRVKTLISIDPGQWTIVRLDSPTRKGKIPPDVDVIRLADGTVAGWQFKKRAPRGYLNQLNDGFLGPLGGY